MILLKNKDNFFNLKKNSSKIYKNYKKILL